MNADNPTSGSSSARTSSARPNAPKPSEPKAKSEAPPPEAPDTTLSESEFLARQAATARLAIGQAFKDIRTRLAEGANPAAWAAEHPWITVSAAAAAGFVATAVLVPSKEQQALNKLAAIERTLNPPPPSANGKSKEEKQGLLATILLEGISLLRPILSNLLAANLATSPPNPPPEAESSGMP